MSEQNQSKLQVLKFAVTVCLACSLVVSTAAVSLRSLQGKNISNEKRTNILRTLGLVSASASPTTKEIQAQFENIIPVVVNFKTGELSDSKNPESYDMYEAAQGIEGHDLVNDPASIKRQADDGNAYVLVENGKIKSVAIPVQGYGLWSTLYGYTAVNIADQKLEGLTFYQQSETAGLGAEITNPVWQKKWNGILPYDQNGIPQIQVKKAADASTHHQIDALAGATLTSQGVENLMNYWLGENGYRQFIKNLQEGRITIEEMRKAAKIEIKPEGRAS